MQPSEATNAAQTEREEILKALDRLADAVETRLRCNEPGCSCETYLRDVLGDTKELLDAKP